MSFFTIGCCFTLSEDFYPLSDLTSKTFVSGLVIGKDDKRRKINDLLPELNKKVGEEEKEMFGRERGLVRIAKGKAHPEDMQFVILRLPIECFPEDEITSQERTSIQKHNQHYIFRGFAFNESAETAKEERPAA